jgi:hypothetical protein
MGLGNFMGGGASANDGESGGSAGKKDTVSRKWETKLQSI